MKLGVILAITFILWCSVDGYLKEYSGGGCGDGGCGCLHCIHCAVTEQQVSGNSDSSGGNNISRRDGEF